MLHSINLPSHYHREDPSNNNRVEHLQPEVMAFEAESAESVNDVQVSHFQRHQQIVDTHMGKMLQGKKLLLLSLSCYLQSLVYMETSCHSV
jgi:hypothetical protein